MNVNELLNEPSSKLRWPLSRLSRSERNKPSSLALLLLALSQPPLLLPLLPLPPILLRTPTSTPSAQESSRCLPLDDLREGTRTISRSTSTSSASHLDRPPTTLSEELLLPDELAWTEELEMESLLRTETSLSVLVSLGSSSSTTMIQEHPVRPPSPPFLLELADFPPSSSSTVININPAENPSNVGSFRPSSSSEWPQFNSATSPNRATLSGQVGLPSLDTQTVPLTGRSPTISPSPRVGTNSPHAGTDSSITRSVPGTPQAGFGVGRTSLGGVGAGGLRRELGSPGLDVNGAGGLGETQRGFSNPDLAKAFGRSMGNFQKGDDFGPLHDDVSSRSRP